MPDKQFNYSVDYTFYDDGSCGINLNTNDLDFARELQLDILFKISRRSEETATCEKQKCGKCCG